MMEHETLMRGDDERCPRYEVLWEIPKSRRWAIFVFVINEGEKVRMQLRAMKQYTNLVDLCIADGGSTDGSLDAGLMEEVGAKALLVKRGAGKLSSQMRMAFDYSLAEGYDGVLVIDGNGKDGLDGIPRMVAALEQGKDHVQGSRFISGGTHENTPLTRLIAVRLIHAPLISIASRRWQTDTTNGFRAYSRALLEDSRVSPLRACFDRYQLHYHLAIESARLGFSCGEIPVSRKYPASGKTPTKINGIRGLYAVMSQLLCVCIGTYRLRS
jgi:dolichol-phosphate mannosyltransferase